MSTHGTATEDLEAQVAAIASEPAPRPSTGAQEAPRKQYSGMGYDGRKTWTVPRWLKEAFVAFAVAAVVAVGASKAVQHFGGAADRARTVLEADELSGQPAFPFQLPVRGGGTLDLSALKGKLVLVIFNQCQLPDDDEPREMLSCKFMVMPGMEITEISPELKLCLRPILQK